MREAYQPWEIGTTGMALEHGNLADALTKAKFIESLMLTVETGKERTAAVEWVLGI